MSNGDLQFSKDLIKILIKAAENKTYGSVEVYFEAGKITQITQRIINKVNNINSKQRPQSKAEVAQPQA